MTVPSRESLYRLAQREAALANRSRSHPADPIPADSAWPERRYERLLGQHEDRP